MIVADGTERLTVLPLRWIYVKDRVERLCLARFLLQDSRLNRPGTTG
jgi:hypothetical protein